MNKRTSQRMKKLDEPALTMDNMHNYTFIKKGNDFYKEYVLAPQPIETQDGTLGGIYRMFLNSKNLGNMNKDDLLSLQGSQYSQSTSKRYLSRVIKLEKIKSYKLQEFLEDARQLYKLINSGKTKNYACGFEGIHFNEKN